MTWLKSIVGVIGTMVIDYWIHAWFNYYGDYLFEIIIWIFKPRTECKVYVELKSKRF